MVAAFALITQTADELLINLPPASQLLHRYLLRDRPAGTEFEIDLQDFRDWSFQARYKLRPYCWEWVKQAFRWLIKVGLVEVVINYTYRYKKIRVFRESTFEIEYWESTSKNWKKSPSNPHSSVGVNIESIDEIQQPMPATAHPVEEKNSVSNAADLTAKDNSLAEADLNPPLAEEACQNGMETKQDGTDKLQGSAGVVSSESVVRQKRVIPPPSRLRNDTPPKQFSRRLRKRLEKKERYSKQKPDSPSPAFSKAQEELFQEVERHGIQLHAQLKKLVVSVEAEVVSNVLAAFRANRKTKGIRNPAGFLVRGIKEQWKPNVPVRADNEPIVPTTHYPAEFLLWYESVEKIHPSKAEGKSGKVIDISKEHLPRHMDEPAVRLDRPLHFRAPDSRAVVPWREAMREFPVEGIDPNPDKPPLYKRTAPKFPSKFLRWYRQVHKIPFHQANGRTGELIDFPLNQLRIDDTGQIFVCMDTLNPNNEHMTYTEVPWQIAMIQFRVHGDPDLYDMPDDDPPDQEADDG